MNLLLIAPELYPIPSSKGTSVETCMYHIARQLAKRHRVTVLSRRDRGLPHMTVRGNLRMIRMQGRSKAAYLAAVLRWARGKTFDYVQVDNRPDFLPRLKKCFPHTPVALFLHSLTYVKPPKASIQIVRRQLRHAAVIIANSESLKRQLVSRFPQHARKIKVVHLGVDLTQFRPPSVAERRDVRKKYRAEGSLAIVYAGRIIPMKGVHVLIKAVEIVRRKIPKTKLYVAGSGATSYMSAMRKLAKRANVPVHFIGSIRRKSIHEVYWLADCFVCPTQGHESFGLVVVEALASGVPTVASRNGGIKEIIRHRDNGMLVSEYRKAHAFAKAITQLGKDRQLAKRLGSRGRAACEAGFHWRKTAGHLERLYRLEKGK